MPFWPFIKKTNSSFEIALRERLNDHNADLPEAVWSLVSWLERKGQCFQYTSSQEPFLSTSLVRTKDDLWSHVSFVLPPDMVRHWFGKQGYEQQVIPFIRCGADGSYIALWKGADAVDRFVFLGSEGEAFVVAESPKQFIALITMGYVSIEGRDVLAASPEQVCREMNDTIWPEPIELKTWAVNQLGIFYPKRGEELLPYDPMDDPFQNFVTQVINS